MLILARLLCAVTIDPALKYCYTVSRLCAFSLAQRRETDAFILGRINRTYKYVAVPRPQVSI
jgi:hypothetical protein